MLKKIRIQNFKCYSKPQDFELSWINFIYGNNSVGKSTFLQAVEKIIHGQEKNHGEIPRGPETSFKGGEISPEDTWMLRLVKNFDLTPREMVLKLVKSTGENHNWHLEAPQTDSMSSPSEFPQFIPSHCQHVEAGETEKPNDFAALGEELTQAQIDLVNQMFGNLQIGYRCLDAHGLYDTVLDFGPLVIGQVGAGIRRIFKCAKSLARWETGILLLEEPETNVNEDQLAALTKIIVDRALELKQQGADAQIVVECHSEHMLLKLLTLIAHGAISPEDIRVAYVTKDVDGSAVTPCEVTQSGKLRAWPHRDGFFGARDKILFGGS